MVAQTGPLQVRRLTSAQLASVTPAEGEPVLDKTNKQLRIGDGVTVGGVNLANAATASKLATPRNISVGGAVSGSVSFDGSADVSIATTLATSIPLTGTPTTPTAAADTNTTQIASTAFVVSQAASAAPLVDGTATVGTSLRYARQDHVHPTDLSRAPLASPGLTGTPTAPTPAIGTNTTQLATSAMIQAEIANKRVWTNYTPTVTATSGTFTSASANGRYMVAFGVCHVQIAVTVTTKGTGAFPIVSLPFAALSGSVNYPLFAREKSVNNKSGSAYIDASLLTLTITDYAAAELATANGAIIYINGSYPLA